MPRFEGNAARNIDRSESASTTVRAARDRSVRTIPTGRAEYQPGIEPPRRGPEGHVPSTREPKVRLAEDVQREEYEAGERHMRELREKMLSTRDRFMSASEHARGAGRGLIREFRDALASKKMTDEEMDDWGERLADMRDDLEDLNREMRAIPADRLKVSDIQNENFKAIEEIQDAVAASRMEPSKALAEITFGAGVRGREDQRQAVGKEAAVAAEDIEADIKEKYGMHPEELMAKGSGWSGLKFRFLNSLSRLAGQDSLYTRWRNAVAAAEEGEKTAGMRRLHEAQERPSAKERAAEAERLAAEARERRPSESEAKAKQMQKNREFAVRLLSRERAATIWDDVKGQMDIMASEHPSGWSFSPEEYVVEAARYTEALEKNDDEGIRIYRKALDTMNEELDYPEGYDPLVGAGRTRLMKARAIGGPSRARGEMAAETSTVTGIRPRTEAAPKASGAQFEEPDMSTPIRISPEVEELRTNMTMDIARAKALVPDAEELWDKAHKALKKDKGAISLAVEAKRYIPKPKDLETAYVFAVARLNDALLGKDKKRIEKERKNVEGLNQDLGFNGPEESAVEEPKKTARVYDIPKPKAPPKKTARVYDIPKPKAPPRRKAA